MRERQGLALFGASLFIAFVALVVFRDTAGYALQRPDGVYEGDINHYVHWTRLVTLGGVQDAYGGSWPETYAVYPPVTLYGYQALGTLYQWLVDPSFDALGAQASAWLHHGIKAVAVAWHTAAALAIYWLARALAGPWRGALAGTLYALNPAALFDAAHWAQPDGAHSLFAVLAVGLLARGRPGWAGAATAFAVLAKPQAVAIVPLLVAAGARGGGAKQLTRAAAAGVASGLVIVTPFILTGRLHELLSLPGVISSVMPVISANAHNVWWLLGRMQGLEPLFTLDTGTLVAGHTYRTLAALLVVGQFAFTYWLFWTRRASLAEAAALGTLGWFLFTTQAHENHLFFVLPLLSLAWPSRPKLLAPYAALSLTILLNMALHDQPLLQVFGRALDDPLAVNLRTCNAIANLAVWALWATWGAVRLPADRFVTEAAGASAPLSHEKSIRRSDTLPQRVH